MSSEPILEVMEWNSLVLKESFSIAELAFTFTAFATISARTKEDSHDIISSKQHQ